MPEIEKMIRWSALNVSRRKPASSAAIDIYRTLVATDSDQSPCRTPAKAESCANEKTTPVGYTITWRALFFPDNRIFYKAYS